MMKSKIFIGLSVLALSACNTFETDDLEYNNPGSDVYISEMITGGQYLDDYYVDVASWENRAKWNLANVHDPSVVLADDGYYYMYQTDAGYGDPQIGYGLDRGHFICRRSKDLVNWQLMGATMHGVPGWIEAKVNEIRKEMGLDPSTTAFSSANSINYQKSFGYWAPCVRKVKDGLYRMYYVITLPGTLDGTEATWSERCFIGLMESSDPSNIDSWVDKGYVMTNYSDKELEFNVPSNDWANCYYKYNAIDPSYVIKENGEHWLVYGSWHSGFAAVELDPETGKTKATQGMPWGADNEAAYGQRIFTRQNGNRWQASEAPEVIYRDGYYYMFVAYDELAVAYNTRVVRSQNIIGPYVDILGTDVTNNGGEAYPILTHPYAFKNSNAWVGISHCAVFQDGNDNWYYASQQRFENGYNGNGSANALMLGGVRSIIWTEDGWPLVSPERYAGVEQTAITENELVGEWENIMLRYSFQKVDKATSLTLNADHKVAADETTLDGLTWSFDAAKNILTVGTMKLYLRRDLNWETEKPADRKPTIVYAGLSSDKKTTLWGKKVK